MSAARHLFELPIRSLDCETFMLENIKKELPIISVILVAVGQFLCALDAGHSTTVFPLPAWVNDTANVANFLIGLLVLIPKTRTLSASLSVVVTLIAIATNYSLVDYDLFLASLPFNLVLIGVSLYVYLHYRRVSLRTPTKPNVGKSRN